MIHAALDNRWDEAGASTTDLFSMRVNFVETNPVPVKAAFILIEEVYRLPLCTMQPKNREKLETALRELKLIA